MSDVIDYLERAYTVCPNKIMLSDENRRVTYKEVRNNARKIAAFLENEIYAQKPILILTEQSSYIVELFWSVLYSNNFYVPFNYKINKEIFCEILDELKPLYVLSVKKNEIVEKECYERKIAYYSYEQLLLLGEKCKYRNKLIPNCNLAYMVYTSGSTGKPKGVIKTHRSIKAFIESFYRSFPIENAVFGNQTEFDYDVATKDIYLTVYTLGTLEIIPKKYFLMIGKLLDYLFEKKITVLIWSVAGVRYVAKSSILTKIKNHPPLQMIFFSGEVLDTNDLKKWIKEFPNVRYINLYAPSEVTGNCLYYEIDNLNIPDRLPLGTKFDNIDVFVLNEKGISVKEGERGEIYIRGDFLSSGYYKDNQKTKEKFKQNPLHNDYIDYVYQTGDLVELINGELYFIGRIDEQIKFMGHRIELTEIEYAFSKLKLGQCCCCFNSEKNELIAFHNSKKAQRELIEKLLTILPKYKLPTTFVYVAEFLYNKRGKIDKKNMLLMYKEKI